MKDLNVVEATAEAEGLDSREKTRLIPDAYQTLCIHITQ